MDLPLPLRQRLESGQCVLFLGAGIGRSIFRPDGSSMPIGSEMARIIDTQLGLNTGSDNLAKVAQIAQIRRRRADLVGVVQEALSGYEPSKDVIELTRVKWDAVFTTNYDRGLVRAYELNPDAPQRQVIVSEAGDLANLDRRFDVPIFFLHGNIFGANPEKILISEDDYALFQRHRRMLFDNLRVRFADSTFLYIGYSNNDPNWSMLQAEIRSEFRNKPLPNAYRVATETDPLDAEVLEARGLVTLTGSLSEFADAVRATVHPTRVISALVDTHVPKSFEGLFQDVPVPILRFLNSWEVCNDADFGQSPNTSAFLRGDRANWGTIAKGNAGARDITSELYDYALEFATRPEALRNVAILLGPAGYGTSTILMDTAFRLVRENAGMVFRLRAGAEPIEADVLFACQSFPDARCFFLIDNAATFKRTIRSTLHLLHQNNLAACFLVGARLNEWRVAQGFVSGQEFPIEPLSDAEVTALLSVLERAGELGDLARFTADERFKLVKARSNKELLVMLREVTEGKQFDAILEDEYRNIPEGVPRKLYETVCGLWQEGYYLRDTVAAAVLGCDTTELFHDISPALDGVVFHEALDEANGIYGFRTRHRTIARVVWHRCVSGAEREVALVGVISNLNLLYGADKEAFDALVQSDELVDSMPSLEGRIAYFESATSSDPRNPYVRQHFARMYLRAERFNSALAQIEQALGENRAIRSLHHTRGLILDRLMRNSPSTDIARKYMAQSEAEYQFCIDAEPRDEYGYQSLAELYRDWADRCSDLEEATVYYRKSEEIIALGLRKTAVHDRLHIESAKVAASLGSQPDRLNALKRAVDSNTASVVARYLYGRALRENGDHKKAIEVLSPLFLEDPDSFRAAIELALSTVAMSGDFSKGAAILHQASLFGLKDANYVATRGGMEFLAKHLDASKETFAAGRLLPAEEQRRIRFKPEVNGGGLQFGPVKLQGTVVRVSSGFCFVSVPGYLDIFVPTDRLDGQRFKLGENIEFQVQFNAVGAVADPTSLRRI